jgi:hypothetical protein
MAIIVEPTELLPWCLVHSYMSGWRLLMSSHFVKLTSNVNGRLEDGGHDRGKKASKLLDATTAFSSIVYGGIEECEATYVIVNQTFRGS